MEGAEEKFEKVDLPHAIADGLESDTFATKGGGDLDIVSAPFHLSCAAHDAASPFIGIGRRFGQADRSALRLSCRTTH